MISARKNAIFSGLSLCLGFTVEWRIKDQSLGMALQVLFEEMAKYYIRSGQYEKVYKTSRVLLDPSYRKDQDYLGYILLDMACQNLPPEFTEALPENQTLAYGVKEYVLLFCFFHDS